MKKLFLILWMILCTSPVLAYNKNVKINDEFVVIVGADWCPACKTLDKTFETPEVKAALKPYTELFHVDGDRDSRYVRYYRIRAYPTVLKFKKTSEKKYKELSRFVGAMSKEKVVKWLKKKSVIIEKG